MVQVCQEGVWNSSTSMSNGLSWNGVELKHFIVGIPGNILVSTKIDSMENH